MRLSRQMKRFAAISRARNEAKRCSRKPPFAGQQFDDGRIRLAVFGRRPDRQPQRHAAIGFGPQTFNPVAPAAGPGVNPDAQAVRGEAEGRGLR